MSQDRFTLFEKVTTGKLMEAISKSMDDFLYIFDINHKVIFDYLFKSSYMPV